MKINAINNILLLFYFAGVKGLHAFVEVALDTTDDDTTITQLSDLRTVGNAISKLLFHLPEPCGLNDLVKACDNICREEYFHQKLLVSTYMLLLPGALLLLYVQILPC